MGYRGELMIIFRCRTSKAVIDKINEIIAQNYLKIYPIAQPTFPYEVGDRVCQLRISKRTPIEWKEVETFEDLSNSDRGNGGFGSTGR